MNGLERGKTVFWFALGLIFLGLTIDSTLILAGKLDWIRHSGMM